MRSSIAVGQLRVFNSLGSFLEGSIFIVLEARGDQTASFFEIFLLDTQSSFYKAHDALLRTGDFLETTSSLIEKSTI